MKAVMIHPMEYDSHPRGHEPDRFQAIVDELKRRGHTVLPLDRTCEADVALFNSGVWNLPEGGSSHYHQGALGTVIHQHTPVVWFDDFDHVGSDTFAGAWPGTDDWNHIKGFDFGLHDFAYFGWTISRPGANRLLYFMRKMQYHQTYPDYVVPLEYPVLAEFPMAYKDELFARPFDVCGLANIALQRAHAFIGLHRDHRIKADCEILVHYRRLDYNAWIARHRQAKLAADFDASLGSERTLRLFTVAPILRGRSDHRLPFPLEDMKHWVVVGEYDGYLSKADMDKILQVVNDKELLYSIYTTGADFIRAHYSLEARTRYIIDHIERFV
jgi:hypothetical protein